MENYLLEHKYEISQQEILARPREILEPYSYQESERQKIVWSFPNSIFAAYKEDNRKLMDKCFEYDW